MVQFAKTDKPSRMTFAILVATALTAYYVGRVQGPSQAGIVRSGLQAETSQTPVTAEAQCLTLGEQYAAELGTSGTNKDTKGTFTGLDSVITAMIPTSFHELAKVANTDKVVVHSYAYTYERYLHHVRCANLKLLEIGLGCNMATVGASLKLWRAYLPLANISFIEYDKTCGEKHRASVEQKAGGRLYIGDQADPALLASIVQDGPFDIIIDDGSHEPNHQYASISHLWPAVKSGGVYIIEDLAQHWWGNPERIDAWNDSMSDFKVVMPLYQRMIRTINCRDIELGAGMFYEASNKEWCRKELAASVFNDVAAIDCSPEICVLVKGHPPPKPAETNT